MLASRLRQQANETNSMRQAKNMGLISVILRQTAQNANSIESRIGIYSGIVSFNKNMLFLAV